MATLFLVATPIGNLGDITLRALETLRAVEALACEDTRVTRRIFERHGIPLPPTVLSYHEHNEERAGGRILDILAAGRDVALCSDAGTPSLSDPGFRIVRAAIDQGASVQVLPGACAAVAALAASGLPSSSYTFLGFPPRKAGRLRNLLAAEKERPHTLVLYESPHRVGKFLAAAAEVLGDRHAAVCIELTKKFERILRGTLANLAADFADRAVKGEVTIVVAGNHPRFCADAEDDADRSADEDPPCSP